jgi:biopolymer transport protein ExbB
MTTLSRTTLLLAGALVTAAGVQAEPAATAAPAAPAVTATSLDELLERVRRGNESQEAEDAAREAAFRDAKAERLEILRRAEAERAAAEAAATELERTYDENEVAVPELQEQLRQRMGTLGELFGVVRQVAGDTLGVVDQSVVSAQIPGRKEVLVRISKSKELPAASDLEGLWYAIQQEMTETGKVVRFPATVVGADGAQETRDVIRIGAFNVVADGRYLEFSGQTGKLVELPSQPATRHLDTIEDLEGSSGDVVGVALDPSKGQILGLLIQAPTLGERVGQGGLVGFVILALGVAGLGLAAARLWYLAVAGRKIRAQVGDRTIRDDNALGRVLGVYERNRERDLETLELKLDEAILKETPVLERGNTLIKVLSVVAPLLGLLGTVTGMIEVFQQITLYGTGDPKIMAGGISQALVTTVLGLVMAIPLLLLHSVLHTRSRSLVQILDEQSAGIVAEHAEAARPVAHALAG